MKTHLLVFSALLCVAAPAAAGEEAPVLRLTVEGGKEDQTNVPVRLPLTVPKAQAKITNVVVKTPAGMLPGQLTGPSIVTEWVAPAAADLVRRDLHFIVPQLKAGGSLSVEVDLGQEAKAGQGAFHWVEGGKDWTELRFKDKLGDRPVLRYMHKPYDDSSKDARDKSYKVFHHLYDPEGKRIVTNGGHTDPYTDAKKLLYPHHRGLMFAFNRITYDGNKKADTWHCPKEHVSHVSILSAEAGAVLGRHRVLLEWIGPQNDVFAREEREFTVYNVPGGTLVEFATRLKTVGGPIKLDGDPQHAGFQFRAANEVAEKTAKQTYYLRPDGKGKPGETRNWEPKTKKGPTNLPWNAMSFVLGDQRYTVAYLDHPNNPGEKRYSERDYGRFGCYFEYDLTKDRPLILNHRVWLQKGEMTQAQVEELSREFTAPPKVTVK